MISNSQIFTTTVFGNSSGLTQEEINLNNTKVMEEVYKQNPLSKMNDTRPIVPSNQQVAKGK